jgi:methyl-accepting chemotaxis protein
MLRGLRALSGPPEPRQSLDEAQLFGFQERASRATEESMSTCQAAGATAAEQRSSLDAAADHARLLLSRSRDIKSAAEQVREILERVKLIALNAGLEGSRMGESGRALVSVADEMRALVTRGLDALGEHLVALDQVERERERLREYVERARQTAGQLAEELLRAQGAQREASSTLDEFREHLQRTTGTDPETARAAAAAAEHARELSTTFSRLSSRGERRLVLRALAPSLEPLLRLLRELESTGGDADAE